MLKLLGNDIVIVFIIDIKFNIWKDDDRPDLTNYRLKILFLILVN